MVSTPNLENQETKDNFTDSSSITNSHDCIPPSHPHIYDNISHNEYDDCNTYSHKKYHLTPPHTATHHSIQNHVHISTNIPNDVQVKIKKMINIFLKTKIIAIQACNSLRSTFCEKFTIIKLTELLDSVQEIYTDLTTTFFSSIDSTTYDLLVLNYATILLNPTMEKYVDLILMIDDGIFKLKKFLISF